MPRPEREDYRTGAEYRWAAKLWRAKHGGSMLGNVGVAILAGAITGSALALVAFVVLAVVVTLARRRGEPPAPGQSPRAGESP
jgi:TRAP-type C4-dicarboxylate transport system permease large subunit